METIAGELVGEFYLEIDGVKTQVTTPNVFGDWLGYDISHICRMCDEGKLIAYKRRGLWWLPVDQMVNLQDNA